MCTPHGSKIKLKFGDYLTNKSLRAMQHSAESIFVVEYLCEYESIFETALAHESVAQRYRLREKTRNRKSRETNLLKGFD
jgi:hypothetical protein